LPVGKTAGDSGSRLIIYRLYGCRMALCSITGAELPTKAKITRLLASIRFVEYV